MASHPMMPLSYLHASAFQRLLMVIPLGLAPPPGMIQPIMHPTQSYLGRATLSFFQDVPEDAPALFSTRMGTAPKRLISINLADLPPPIVRSNIEFDAKIRATALLTEYPRLKTRHIKKPVDWKDLYQCFDAVDLYIEGLDFCYLVMLNIGKANELHQIEADRMIDDFAYSWITEHQSMILASPRTSDPMNLLTDRDGHGLAVMQPEELALLSARLRHHKYVLMQDKFAARPQLDILSKQDASVPVQISVDKPYSIQPGEQPLQFENPRYIADPPDFNTLPFTRHHHNRSYLLARDRALSIETAGSRFSYAGTRGLSNDTAKPRRFHAQFNSNFTTNACADFAPRESPHKFSVTNNHDPVWVHKNQRAPPSEQQSFEPCLNTRPRWVSDTIPIDTLRKVRRQYSEDLPALSPIQPIQAQVGPVCVQDYEASSNHLVTPSNQSCGSEVQLYQDSKSKTSAFPIDKFPHMAFSYNGSRSIRYGPVRSICNDNKLPRSVYFRNASERSFLNHEMQRIMSECGDVETITYLATTRGEGFVLFGDVISAGRAIDRWNNQMAPDGNVLQVNERFKKRHCRSDSSPTSGNTQQTFEYQDQNPTTACVTKRNRSFSAILLNECEAQSQALMLYERHLNSAPPKALKCEKALCRVAQEDERSLAATHESNHRNLPNESGLVLNNLFLPDKTPEKCIFHRRSVSRSDLGISSKHIDISQISEWSPNNDSDRADVPIAYVQTSFAQIERLKENMPIMPSKVWYSNSAASGNGMEMKNINLDKILSSTELISTSYPTAFDTASTMKPMSGGAAGKAKPAKSAVPAVAIPRSYMRQS